MAEIVVVGSVNMDLVVATPRIPQAGETILGRSFATVPGGKGANQAFGAARLGGRVAMVGCVGSDAFGEPLVGNLAQAGVETRYMKRLEQVPSGVALIAVDECGENSIVVVAGANAQLSCADVDAALPAFEEASVLMVQLEVPLAVVEYAVGVAKSRAMKVILDPAPAQPLPASLLGMCDYITPNRTEAEMLTGTAVRDLAAARQAGEYLRAQGVEHALVKLGREGVLVLGPQGEFYANGFSVDAVDTTAAGDAFAAGLGLSLARGKSLSEAVGYANAVAALSVTRFGAQSSMPSASEVERLLLAPDSFSGLEPK